MEKLRSLLNFVPLKTALIIWKKILYQILIIDPILICLKVQTRIFWQNSNMIRFDKQEWKGLTSHACRAVEPLYNVNGYILLKGEVTEIWAMNINVWRSPSKGKQTEDAFNVVLSFQQDIIHCESWNEYRETLLYKWPSYFTASHLFTQLEHPSA